MNQEIAVYDNTISARTYLSYIAEQAGGFAYIGRNGKLYIKKIGESVSELNNKYLKDMTWGDKFAISQVAYEDGIQDFKEGDTTYHTLWISQDNMYIVNEEQIKGIYEYYGGFEAYGFEGSSIIDPALDIGDIVIIDGKRVIYQGDLDYSGKFKVEIKSQIQSKEKQETTNRKVSNETKIRRVESKIDQESLKITQLTKEVINQEEKMTQMEQDVNQFKFSVSNSGGSNLVKNSVGWANLDFWQIDHHELFFGSWKPGYVSQTGEIAYNPDNGDIYTEEYFEVEKNKTYLFEAKPDLKVDTVTYYDGNKTFLFRSDVLQKNDITIPDQNDIAYIRIMLHKAGGLLPEEIESASFKEETSIKTNQSDEVVKNSLSKSAFELTNGILTQSFEVEQNKEYAIGFKIKKPLVGEGYVKIVGDTLIQEFTFENAKEYQYQKFDCTFKANTQVITLQIYSNCGMLLTDLIANTGDLLSQWQPYAQELYALGVQIDTNGIKTYDNVSQQEVSLTPTGLSGYFQNEEVFTINQDTTQTKKFQANQEINMLPIKIIAVPSGWDFVYID